MVFREVSDHTMLSILGRWNSECKVHAIGLGLAFSRNYKESQNGCPGVRVEECLEIK